MLVRMPILLCLRIPFVKFVVIISDGSYFLNSGWPVLHWESCTRLNFCSIHFDLTLAIFQCLHCTHSCSVKLSLAKTLFNLVSDSPYSVQLSSDSYSWNNSLRR